MLTHSKVPCPFFSGCLKGEKKERERRKTQTKTDAKDPSQDSYSLPQRNQRATAQAPLGWLLPSLKCGRNSPPWRPLSFPPLSLSPILFFPPRKTSIMKNEQIKVIQVPPFSEHSHLFLTRADPENGITLQRGTPRHP